MDQQPSVDDLFPAQPKSVDDLFPPQVEADRYRRQTLGTSPIQDLIFGDTTVNPIARVLDAFGQGFKQGWGSEPAGLSQESTDSLKKAGVFNDYDKGQKSIIKAANESLFRSAAVGLVDPIMRGLPAGFAGLQAAVAQTGEEAGQPELGREAAAGFEAFPTGLRAPTGIPHAAPHPILNEIEQAKSLGVIGAGEDGYFGTAPSPGAEAPISGPQTPAKPVSMPVDLFAEPRDTSVGAAPQIIAGTKNARIPEGMSPEDAERFGYITRSSEMPASVEAEATPGPIAQDVAAKLTAAGRPAEEAAASGQIIESHYQARAARFEGVRGTAEDLYNAEGPEIKPGEGAGPATSEPIKPEPTGGAGAAETPKEMAQGIDLGKELNQAAYHGSPYDFDAFDTGKIGTGEGAQVYGHGLYFAENESVARGYQKGVIDKKWFDETNARLSHLAKEMDAEKVPGSYDKFKTQKGRDLKAEYDRLLQERAEKKGNLYRVNIKPEPHQFLQWDKRLNEQTPEIQDKLKQAMGIDYHGKFDQAKSDRVWKEFQSADTGAAIRQGFIASDDKLVSKRLSEAGIPGIRYLDQGSRPLRNVADLETRVTKAEAELAQWNKLTADKLQPTMLKSLHEEIADLKEQIAEAKAKPQTHNYVVFDPKDIEITDKNGKPVSQREFELDQIKRGKINLRNNAKPIITLFKDANASTFIHETGHAWLEELMQDAEHPLAPTDLKADAVTVLDWLGVRDAQDIKTSHHEKFARGFERYMMEGKAPNQQLAGVFAKFRNWLTKIYQTVTRLKSPINDEIRGVFDRLVTLKPSDVAIEPEAPAKTFADIHEADAETTPPEMAHPAAETIQGERDSVAARHIPEDQDARLKGIADQVGRREAGNPQPAGDANAPRSNAGQAGNAEASGAVGAGGTEAAPESTPTPAVNRSQPPVTAHDKFPDKAGNIRLDNLNTPEDLNQIIRQTAEENGDFQNVRGPVSDAQILDLAEAAGVDAAFIDARKLGEAWTAPQIVALRRLLIQSAQSVHDLAIKAATGGDAEVMAYAEAKARHQLIQERVSSVTAEAGRALRAFQSKFTEGSGDVSAFLKDATGKTLFQLQQEAKFLSKLQTPGQTSKFVNDTSKGTFRNAVLEYYINALISGPVTHTRYIVSNAVNALYTPLVEIPIAAGIGKAREIAAGHPIERVRLGEAGAQLYGMVKGSRDGLTAAIEAFQTGVSPALPNEKVSAQFAEASHAIPGKVGQIIRIPSRSVAGIHSFFKALRYEQNVQALAYRTAATEGLEGDAFSNRVAELTTNPTPAMMTDATTNALKELYMSPTEYHSKMAGLVRFTNQNLAAKIVVPFMKIGSQITRNAFIERTPLGILDSKVRENLTAGSTATDFQAAKIAGGMALMATSVGLMGEGMMTGDGPEDPAKRAVWLLSHTPASIQIGDVTFKYGNTGPLGMLMRFAANTYETAHGMGDKDMATLAVSFFEGFAKSVLDETFLRGLKDMLDAMFHPKEYGGNYLKNQITNWMPWSVGSSQIAKKIDPYQRETHGIFQAAQAKVPWLSEQLMPRRDMFGEPIPNGGPLPDYANDPVVKAMDDLHLGVGKIGKKIRGVELNEQQYDDLARIAGRMAKTRLNAMVGIISNPQVPVAQRVEMIHSTISSSRESARSLIMMQNPDIVKAARDAKTSQLRGTATVH